MTRYRPSIDWFLRRLWTPQCGECGCGRECGHGCGRECGRECHREKR